MCLAARMEEPALPRPRWADDVGHVTDVGVGHAPLGHPRLEGGAGLGVLDGVQAAVAELALGLPVPPVGGQGHTLQGVVEHRRVGVAEVVARAQQGVSLEAVGHPGVGAGELAHALGRPDLIHLGQGLSHPGLGPAAIGQLPQAHLVHGPSVGDDGAVARQSLQVFEAQRLLGHLGQGLVAQGIQLGDLRHGLITLGSQAGRLAIERLGVLAEAQLAGLVLGQLVLRRLQGGDAGSVGPARLGSVLDHLGGVVERLPLGSGLGCLGGARGRQGLLPQLLGPTRHGELLLLELGQADLGGGHRQVVAVAH